LVIRSYELMFILDSELSEEETESALGRIRMYLEEQNGREIALEAWGLRRLAYTIKRKREGRYYLMRFSMDTLKVKEFERSLLLIEPLIRELIIKMDEVVSPPIVESDAQEQGTSDAEVLPVEEQASHEDADAAPEADDAEDS